MAPAEALPQTLARFGAGASCRGAEAGGDSSTRNDAARYQLCLFREPVGRGACGLDRLLRARCAIRTAPSARVCAAVVA